MKNILPAKVTSSVNSSAAVFIKYKLVIFVLLVIGVYGYIFLTISALTGAQPSDEQVSEYSSPIKTTKVDKQVVKQLEQLQDNSGSVKALFDQARNNPFQEN